MLDKHYLLLIDLAYTVFFYSTYSQKYRPLFARTGTPLWLGTVIPLHWRVLSDAPRPV